MGYVQNVVDFSCYSNRPLRLVRSWVERTLYGVMLCMPRELGTPANLSVVEHLLIRRTTNLLTRIHRLCSEQGAGFPRRACATGIAFHHQR